MKTVLKTCVACALLIGAQSWSGAKQSNIGQYAYLTQDAISLNGDDLKWNGSIATMDEIRSHIKSSHSLQVSAYNPEFSQLMALLQLVKDSGIEDRLIRLDLFGDAGAGGEGKSEPDEAKTESIKKPNALLKLKADGQLLLSDEPVELADLSELLPATNAVSFIAIGSFQFSRVHEVLQTLNPIPRGRLMVQLRQQVQVEAKVVEIKDDGKENTLSSPSFTTEPGYMASMGVQDTQPQTKEDLYQQNGRSGGGVTLKALPQVIGDYIKLTGSISLKRIKGSEAFEIENESIRNYTTETIVIPFAYVFDKDTDSVEFDPVEIGGKKIVCSLKAYHVSDRGEKINPSRQ